MIEKLKEWALDVFETIFGIILDIILFIIDLIPLPEFITDGLVNLAALLPVDLKYILVHASIPECLTILAAGVTFRLLRKFITLFQW